jgi:hypothetical protein
MADRDHAEAHNDSPLGPTLPAGIREALEPIRSSGRRILEDGRDIYEYKGWWTLGLLVLGCGQGRPDRRLLPE